MRIYKMATNKDNEKNDKPGETNTGGKSKEVSKELRSDYDWRNLVAEGYEEWIAKGQYTHFVTINYNIWRSFGNNVLRLRRLMIIERSHQLFT